MNGNCPLQPTINDYRPVTLSSRVINGLEKKKITSSGCVTNPLKKNQYARFTTLFTFLSHLYFLCIFSLYISINYNSVVGNVWFDKSRDTCNSYLYFIFFSCSLKNKEQKGVRKRYINKKLID